jgi:hypothetical protein
MYLLFAQFPDGFSILLMAERVLKMCWETNDVCDRQFSEKSRGVNWRRPKYNTEISPLGTWGRVRKCTYNHPWATLSIKEVCKMGPSSIHNRAEGHNLSLNSIASWQCISSQIMPYTDLSWSQWYPFDRTSTILDDLTPCDFWLLPKTKATIAGRSISRIQDLAKAVHIAIRDTPTVLQNTANAFRNGERGCNDVWKSNEATLRECDCNFLSCVWIIRNHGQVAELFDPSSY